MNYQPFLDMHILISDDFLLQLQQLKPALSLLALLIFIVLYCFVLLTHRLLVFAFTKRQRYSRHDQLGSYYYKKHY